MASYDQLNERAFILPVLGFIILTPPLLFVFNVSSELFGIPVLYLYAFLTWAALILAGKLLADKLQKEEQKRSNRLKNKKSANKRDQLRS